VFLFVCTARTHPATKVYLSSVTRQEFLDTYFAVIPFAHSDCDQRARGALIERILTEEYGYSVISCLSQRLQTKSAKEKLQQREDKLQAVSEANEWEEQIARSWPKVVEDDIVFECLEDYRQGSVWSPPAVCVPFADWRDMIQLT
jgi:hypothetical protein